MDAAAPGALRTAVPAREPGAVRRARARGRSGGSGDTVARRVRAPGHTASERAPVRREPSAAEPGHLAPRQPRRSLLDEPTASLDPPQRRKLWQSAVRHKERGGAVVFATQNHEELEGHADRVLVLLEGVLTFDGPLDEYERTELARTLV